MDEIGDGYMRAWRKGANSAFFRCTVAQAGQGGGGGGGGGQGGGPDRNFRNSELV